MSVPAQYTCSKEYLSDVLNFLQCHQWIFNYPNTHILVELSLNNIPHDWREYFINTITTTQLAFDEIKDDYPESLKKLLTKIEKLKPEHQNCVEKCDYNFSHNSGLGKKKMHEILSLAPLINEICEETKTKNIIDVGSGLGYLSHLLNEKYKYRVLGIDCSAKYVKQAYKNQEKLHLKSVNLVNFQEHYINNESLPKIKDLIIHYFPDLLDDKICMVGLHACADLSITILDLFTKLDSVNSLVIMPCCYHRIELKKQDENGEFFKYFPVSNILKELFTECNAEKFIRRPFLRLACQQTSNSFVNMTKLEHESQSRNCFFRAILQAVVEEEHCEVKRKKRKSGNATPSNTNSEEDVFKLYVDNLEHTHELIFPSSSPSKLTITDEKFKEKMYKKWSEHKGDCYLVEVLTSLQAAIQSICENVVLLDRVEFLKERGYKSYTKRVTNDCISPRCHALITEKFSSVKN